MKKILMILLCMIVICAFPLTAAASGGEYTFSLTSAGNEDINIKSGEAFHVKVELSKGTSAENFTMYAASYTFKYSKSYFEMDTSNLEFDKKNDKGIIYTRMEDPKWDNWEDITISVISPNVEGMDWSSPSELISFDMTAKKTGVSTIICASAAVSDKAGNTLTSKNNNLQVTVTGKNEASNDPGSSQNGGGSSQGGSNTGNQNTDSTGGGSNKPASPEIEKPVDVNEAVKTDTVPDVSKEVKFSDVRPSDWYADAVAYVSNRGYFNGLPGNVFAPDMNMSRAMFVTVIGRVEGINTSRFAGSDFTDVSDGRWYSPYIKWAAQEGIVGGVGAGKFDPEGNVTREQMATIIYRYAAYKGYNTEVKNAGAFEQFKDARKVSAYAQQAMQWACSEGVVKGAEYKLEASGKATRAQVAQIIKNFMELIG